ncbi:MAG TPA: acyltransferase family protein, partial [Thermoleophilia bacterium]|nr:acyltransferase family protein [Thermoleophilia bacterium]
AISGFLFFRSLEPVLAGYAAKWRRRVRTLVVPFLLWSAWSLLVYLVVYRLSLGGSLLTEGGGRPSPAAALRLLLVQPVAYPLWFLQALIVCVALTPAIYWLVRALRWAAPLVLAPAWLLDLEYTNFVNFKALTFFTLGAAIAIGLRRGWLRIGWLTLGNSPDESSLAGAVRARSSAGSPSTGAIVLGRWLLPLFVACCLLFTAFLRTSDADWAHLLHKGLMILALAAVWFGYDAWLRGLADRAWVLALTGFSFFLFAAQEPTLLAFKRVAVHALGTTDAALLTVYLLTPPVVIGLCLGAAVLLRRAAPRLYGLLTGGRAPRTGVAVVAAAGAAASAAPSAVGEAAAGAVAEAAD